jgi:hypothetical protein
LTLNNAGGAGAADTVTFAAPALNTTLQVTGPQASPAAGVSSVGQTAGFSTFSVIGEVNTAYLYENTGTPATSELIKLVGVSAVPNIAIVGTTQIHV